MIGAIPNPLQNPPIPPDLNIMHPHPQSPWLFSQGLFEKLQNQNLIEDSHKTYTVQDTDLESQFILAYFLRHGLPYHSIRRITAVHNKRQTHSFTAAIPTQEQEAATPAYAPEANPLKAPVNDRVRVLQRWNDLVAQFSPVEINTLGRIDRYARTKVIPLWHGTSAAKSTSICRSGFTFFGKHIAGDDASTDVGYFGSGIYFTTSARYAHMYGGHLLLSLVSMRAPFPVVSNKPHPEICNDMSTLMGKGAFRNYNAHYIPVASIEPHNPLCMQYFPCYREQVPAWDEFVVFEKSQTLLRFIVEVGPNLPIPVDLHAVPPPKPPAAIKPAPIKPSSVVVPVNPPSPINPAPVMPPIPKPSNLSFGFSS